MNVQNYPNMTEEEICEDKWQSIIKICDDLIDKCNWTQMPDSGLTFTQKTAWLNYRQALREIRETFVNPDDVKFPERP
jgi:hypothetical protein